jgi:TP901 family phage tail tape measure protein
VAVGDETAFFRFDTNANEVAGDVVGAMARINRALSSPADASTTSANIQGFQQAYARLQQDVVTGATRMQQALSQVGSGLLSPDQFRQQYQQIGQSVFDAQRRTIADELALMPRAVADRLPIQTIMADLATSTAQALADGVKTNLGLAQGRLGDFAPQRSDFNQQIQDTSFRPVDYGWQRTLPNGETETQARMLALINEMRALDIIRRNVSAGESVIQRAGGERGFSPDYMSSLLERSTYETDEGRVFVGTDAAKELADMSRESERAAAAGRRLESQMEREKREALQLAAALALVESGYRKYGSVYFNAGTGQSFRAKGQGVTSEVPIMAQVEAEQKREIDDLRRQNQARLLANFNDVIPVGNGMRVLGDEVYNRSYDRVEKSQLLYAEAMEAAAAARAREAAKALRLNEFSDARAIRGEQQGGGVLTGFLNRFHRGDQTVANSMGGQIASAAAFSVAYGSIFALQGIMAQLLQEFLDYQDSLTDLEVATRSTDVVTGNFVNSLSEVSRLAGGNVGQSLDTAARGIRAFSEVGDTAEKIRDIGSATNYAATQLALIAGKSLPDATGDTVAIGTAFQLQADQLGQVVDAVANAKRNVGGDAAQISQGLSLIALSSQEAGYTLNEAAAVIGLVQARTDQSGQAIATRLTRIFQIVSGSTGKNLARDLGVDSGQSVKEQIEDYAKIYSNDNTSEAVRDRISSALGGTANLRELLPLLNENQRLQDAYAEALNNAGQGTDEFNRKSQNLVGTLKQISGDLKNIAVGLGQSGLFDAVGGLLFFLEPTLNGFNQLLNVVNDFTDTIPGMQTVVGLLVDAAIAAKAIGVITARNGLFSAGKSAAVDQASVAARQREVQLINAVVQQRLIAEGRYNEAIMLASAQRVAAERVGAAAAAGGGIMGGVGSTAAKGTMRSGAAAVGGFITGMNPWGLAAGLLAMGGLAAYGQYSENRTELQGIQSASYDSTAIYDRIDGSAESLTAASQDLRATIGEIEKTDVAFYYDDEKEALLDLTRTRQQGIEHLARLVEQEDRLAAKHEKLTVFGDSAIETVDELAKGLAAIAANGGTGLDQFRLLNRALTTPPDQRRIQWEPNELSSEIISLVMGNVGAALPEGATLSQSTSGFSDLLDEKGTKPYTWSYPYTYGSPALEGDGKIIDNKAEIISTLTSLGPGAIESMRQGILDELDRMDIKKTDVLTPEMKTQLAQAAAQAIPNVGQLGKDASSFLVNLMVESQKDLGGKGSGGMGGLEGLLAQPLGLNRRRMNGISELGIDPLTLNGSKLTRNQLNTLLSQGEANPETGVAWQSLQTYLEGALSSIPATDDGTQREAVLNNIVAFLRNRKRAYERGPDGGKPHTQLELLLADFSNQQAEAAVARIEDMREAAETRAETNKELRAIRLKFARRAFAAAKGNPNLIESLMEAMDRQTIEAVQDYLETAVETARAALRHAQRLQATAVKMLQLEIKMGTDTPGMGKDVTAKAQRRADAAQAELDAFNDILNSTAAITEDKATLPKDSSAGDAKQEAKDRAEEARQKAEEARQERAALISAKAAASAARQGGGIAAARAAIIAARQDLLLAKKGTSEYYQALASLYDAQWQMTEAINSYRANQYMLSGDMTDPVEQARDALRAARDRYQSARSKDERAAAAVDVRQSEYALEKARWDQKLSDMQIAQQLGDISYAQYVRYLEREAKRMKSMRNKTRQQIDYMNQIELALQEAQNSAASQFNLGDINLNGFVYQTRRFAAQARNQIVNDIVGGGATGGSVVNSHNQVTIYGTDTRAVRQILREMLGDGVGQTRSTGSARRGG